MASAANQISFLLLALLFSCSSHTQARDSQLFNKLPSATNAEPTTATKPDQSPSNDQPEFLPDNDNSYGLYGHGDPFSAVPKYTGSNQLPSHKYLPKNYNSVAYVTEPEDVNDSVSFNGDENPAVDPVNYYTGAVQDSYIPQQQDNSAYRNYPSAANVGGGGYYYGGGSSFNSEPRGTNAYDTDVSLYRNGGGFRPEGMSDTRALENGKYFYDVDAGRYSRNHPYESLKTASYDRAAGKYHHGDGDGTVYGSHGERYGPEFQPEGNDLP